MRTYRLAPTVLALVLFCIAGNALVLWSLPGESSRTTPEDDAWVLYYALLYADEVPPSLDGATLTDLVEALDRDSAEVAGRFTVIDWKAGDRGFRGVVRHRAGRTFTLTLDGVGHGG